MILNNRNPAAEQRLSRETDALRQQVRDLLNQLLDHREQSEARFAEIGQVDPIKSVTGRSAMDNAIDLTRQLLQDLDSHATASSDAPAIKTRMLNHSATSAKNASTVS